MYSCTAQRTSGWKNKRRRASAGIMPNHRSPRFRCASSCASASEVSSIESACRSGHRITACHQPATSGASTCSLTSNRGQRRKPARFANSAQLCCKGASARRAPRSNARRRRRSATNAEACANTASPHNASKPSRQEMRCCRPRVVGCNPTEPAASAESACVTCCPTCAVTAGGDNNGKRMGDCQASPNTTCNATSHHKAQRAAGGRRGNSRNANAMVATSTAACSDVHSKCESIKSAKRSKAAMSFPLAAGAQFRHQRAQLGQFGVADLSAFGHPCDEWRDRTAQCVFNEPTDRLPHYRARRRGDAVVIHTTHPSSFQEILGAQTFHHCQHRGTGQPQWLAELDRGFADRHLAVIADVAQQRQFTFANGWSGHVGPNCLHV